MRDSPIYSIPRFGSYIHYMALFSKIRSQVSVGLLLFGIGVLGLLGWLIYRTVYLYAFSSN